MAGSSSTTKTLAGMRYSSSVRIRHFALEVLKRDVSYVGAVCHENRQLRDIGRMIANALNSFCDEEVVEAHRDRTCVFHHVRDELEHERAKLIVDGKVISHHLRSAGRIQPRKCVQRTVEHSRSQLAGQPDLSDVDRVRGPILSDVPGLLCDLAGFITGTLQVRRAL